MRPKLAKPPSCYDPSIEAEPSPDRYKSHHPLNAVGFKVRSGDNLASLAQLAGMSAKALVEYNFLTTNSKTVNWYLRNYLGCSVPSPDRKSYSFSGNDNPGILEFPPQAFQKLIAAVGPQQFFEDTNAWEVPGWLPQVFQGVGKWNCWSGCTTAMIMYREGGHSGGVDIAKTIQIKFGKDWLKRHNDGTGIYSNQFRTLCGLAKFTILPGEAPADPFVWVKDLERWGPMMVVRNAGGGDAHVVIVYGYRFCYPSSFQLLLMDPMEFDPVWVESVELVNTSRSLNGSWPKRVRL